MSEKQNYSDLPPAYSEIVPTAPTNIEPTLYQTFTTQTYPIADQPMQQTFIPPPAQKPYPTQPPSETHIYAAPAVPYQGYPQQMHQQFTTPINYGTIPPQVNSGYVTVITVGGCPACGIGRLEDNYPCSALCCAILFFPLGVLCCLGMKNKICNHCGMEF